MWLKNDKNKNLYVKIRTSNLLFVLLSCLLLAGCQRETKSENQHVDVWNNTGTAVTNEIENIKTVDIKLGDISNKNVTIISVLGKEKLTIETKRIYGGESAPGYIDNRFTPEEIDTILNTIEGTWVVDEYVDFIPYENSIWSEEEGTEEMKQLKYEDAVKQAEGNPPDFSFQVKGYNDQEPIAGSHYIYVYNNSKWYASPMSVALSMQEEGEDYSGSKISKVFGYPVIYIDFFSISCSAEGTVSYEPATLVLASDGSFLLLKDGAFYSLKNSIQGNIMSGDFSCLEDEDWESMQKSYKRQNDLYEWSLIDLNGDGIEDLILQEKDTVGNTNRHRILGIFACEEDGAKCVLWDDVDNTEYYFCGPTGELMYSASDYGGVVSEEPYSHYYFDEEWNKIKDYTLVVYCIDSTADEESAEEWKQENPDMAENGLYYRKYTEKGEEILTRKELEDMYEIETGYEFYSSFY